MKKFLSTVLACSMFAVLSFGQIRKVPAEVTSAFKAEFPGATAVEWKDNLANFEASFKLDNISYKASFTGKGALKKTEKSMQWQQLPAVVKSSFDKSKYSDWEKGSVAEVKDHEDGLYYRIFVEKNKIQKKFLRFNTDGKMVDD